MQLPETLNMDYIAAQYDRWRTDPDSVSRDWQFFFKGFETGATAGAAPAGVPTDLSGDQSKVDTLVYRYRELGHILACMDPLTECPVDHPLLNLAAFGLGPDDLANEFWTPDGGERRQAPLKQILADLKATYCRSVGVEYMHLQDPDERAWLQARMEPVKNRPPLPADTRRRILEKLYRAALFEQFLNKKYVGVTRFSLEGGDALIPMLDALVAHAAAGGCREIILGMAHRGRLNVQANILQKPLADIFSEFENCYDPDQLVGAGDVKYHKGYLAELTTADGLPVQTFLVNNPSHLEAVDPVVEGIARARQEMRGGDARRAVLPLLLHGDAAFAGQGIVAETLNMSQLEGYTTGGTLHVVINNQIGYTTLPKDARSTRYSTDVAKMLMVPIFHVHGEDPEAMVHVVQVAVDYRQAFGKDVVIDVVCYRRYGHNEGDEPYFTQPLMYERIRQRPSVHILYGQTLAAEGLVSTDDLERIEKEASEPVEAAYREIHGSTCPFPEERFYANWEGIEARYSHAAVDTAVPAGRLRDLARRLNTAPDGFNLHAKLDRLYRRRLETVEANGDIDWANAESLAFGSLLTEGVAVRLSGQDCGRGTFSQRHSVAFDTQTGDAYLPLNALDEGQAPFEVYNSLLAEASVLGFEYGYSVAQPRSLVLWEAQFGDFVNNAQAIIDLFIASGEAKWQRLSGLVMLLPHGWEGLGPEHSSARLERFLQLCADDNLQVCNLTTPAQYFHLLRRQVKAAFRKPLVLMTPKSLLRLPQAVSTLDDLSTGTFEAVLDDPAERRAPRRVILCAGKIYYQLVQARDQRKSRDTVIVRLEQFYPFPSTQLETIAKRYAKARQWLWVQEEPENMGAWQFVRPRLEQTLGRSVAYVGRRPAASPATGFPTIYKAEQAAISERAVTSGIEKSADAVG